MAPQEPATPAGADPDLIANLYGFYASWALRSPAGLVLPAPEVTLVDSGTPAAELNVAFVTPGAEARTAAMRAAEFFAERARPWRIEVPVALRDRVEEVARSAGLAETEIRPALVLYPAQLVGGKPTPELRIDRVTSPAGMLSFMRTLLEGFGAESLPGQEPTSRIEVPHLSCYLGSVDGEPLATSVLFNYRGVAGIYAVTTLERARRRGYGRAITEKAIRDGLRAGATRGFLQASDMGRPVYEAMGFRSAFDHITWRAPAPAA